MPQSTDLDPASKADCLPLTRPPAGLLGLEDGAWRVVRAINQPATPATNDIERWLAGWYRDAVPRLRGKLPACHSASFLGGSVTKPAHCRSDFSFPPPPGNALTWVTARDRNHFRQTHSTTPSFSGPCAVSVSPSSRSMVKPATAAQEIQVDGDQGREAARAQSWRSKNPCDFGSLPTPHSIVGPR